MQQLIITPILIFVSLFTFSIICSMFDFDLIKNMYPKYYNKIDSVERLKY